MSRMLGPARRWAAVTLAALVAVVIAACTVEPTPIAPDTPSTSDSAGGEPSATSRPRPAPAKPGEARGQPITLAFGGDVHFEGAIENRLARDPETAIGPIAATLRRADLAMVNLETAITERGTPQAKEFTFRAPPTAFRALDAAGIDVVTMANNHGMDFGEVGLSDSLRAAERADFPVVGIGRDATEAFRPYTVTIKGQRVAIIGASQVLDDNLAAAWTAGESKPGLASAYQEERLVAAVRAARRRADTVVVDLHWGREREACPIQRQRDLAPRLVKAGADVVVGSHAHVLLGAGYLGHAYVAYGLGNFVFYAGSGPGTQSGVLTLTVRGRAVTKARWNPAVISGGVPILLNGAAAEQAISSWRDLRGCTGLADAPAA